MSERWTVGGVLSWMTGDFEQRGIDNARLDAELLLARALGCERVRLYMEFDRPLDPQELAGARELVRRRRLREPVAYILAEREFYGRALHVGPAVLIPRPETELLVDRSLEWLPQDGRRALDLCTGSGAVAIALAAERAELQVDATDLSRAALSLAQQNALRHEVADRVQLHEGDLFDALPAQREYDLIVANPPYVSRDDYQQLQPEVRDHEPSLALLAGDDGLSVIDRIVEGAPEFLRPGGRLLIEVGQGQASVVGERLEGMTAFGHVRSHRDLAGVDRIVEATRSSQPS